MDAYPRPITERRTGRRRLGAAVVGGVGALCLTAGCAISPRQPEPLVRSTRYTEKPTTTLALQSAAVERPSTTAPTTTKAPERTTPPTTAPQPTATARKPISEAVASQQAEQLKAKGFKVEMVLPGEGHTGSYVFIDLGKCIFKGIVVDDAGDSGKELGVIRDIPGRRQLEFVTQPSAGYVDELCARDGMSREALKHYTTTTARP